MENAPKIERTPRGGYVVFNGWKNGRRQEIFSTFNKWDADAELESRLAGNAPKLKVAGRQG